MKFNSIYLSPKIYRNSKPSDYWTLSHHSDGVSNPWPAVWEADPQLIQAFPHLIWTAPDSNTHAHMHPSGPKSHIGQQRCWISTTTNRHHQSGRRSCIDSSPPPAPLSKHKFQQNQSPASFWGAAFWCVWPACRWANTGRILVIAHAGQWL